MNQTVTFTQIVVFMLVFQLGFGQEALLLAQTQDKEGRQRGAGGGKSAISAGSKQASKGARLGAEQREGAVSAMPAEEQLPGGQALSRAVVPDLYVLGPGDKLAINLWGEYNETFSASITPDGKISLPTIGDLTLKGLTLTQTQSLVEQEVKKYYRNVKSGVSLVSLRVFEVLVLGEVVKPGTYLATPVRRASDVVERAGGVRKGGTRRYIQLQRNGKLYAKVDLYASLVTGDETANPYLSDGDIVFVPPISEWQVVAYVSEVSAGERGVLNETAVPDIVEIKQGDRLSTVISELGGVNPWWDEGGVFIQREVKEPAGTMRIPVDLNRLILAKDQSQNPEMLPGDEIYIPAEVKRIIVAGAVKVPAAYPYFPGRHADVYIAQAGGLSLFADLDRSFIKRADGVVEPFSGNIELNNGDTVVVLEKALKTYQDYFALFGTITGVVLSSVGLLSIFKK